MNNNIEKELNDRMAFTPRQIDAAYINSLVELVNACRKWCVEINKVNAFQNGWQVSFVGYPHADAICHDHSYGSPCYGGCFDDSVHTNDWSRSGSWETTGFPWDYDDVSVHDAEWLAHEISLLNRGYVYHESDEI